MMNSSTNRLPRRSFLTGAASILGVGSVGLVPHLSMASTQATTPTRLNVHYWDGSQFVSGAQVAPSDQTTGRVRIEISEVGSPHVVHHVDVRLPHGVFHAFTGGPKGAARSAFVVEPSGHALTFEVSRDQVVHEFSVGHAGQAGFSAFGTYLVTDVELDKQSAHLSTELKGELVNEAGVPADVNGVLIRLSAA